MSALLLWPLLPFIASVLPVPSFLGRSKAIWAAVAAGGLGWILDVIFLHPAWGPWLTTGMAWGVASAYVLRSEEENSKKRELILAKKRSLEDEVDSLEKEHVTLRHDVEKNERDKARAFQVYSLAKSLTETLSWEGLVNRFAEVLQKVTGSSDFLLYLAAATGNGLELKIRSGVWSPETLPATTPQKHPQWVVVGRETLLQVPLWQGESLMGLLWVRWAASSHPSMSDIELMFEQLFIGFQKAQLFDRMESMSRIDGLTGVLRRQTFMDQIEKEWQRANLFKTTFSFMLVDVDHFKRINDTYGHQAGDAVLARLGQLLQAGLYETDAVGRYGGEEFGLLLSRAEAEGVRRKAEMLRTRVAAESFTAGMEKLKVTISIGLAHFPRDGYTPAAVMAAADKALYAAKDAGRNRVVDIGDLGGKKF